MKNMRRPPLPDFDHPPVIEVALSILFEELIDFRAIHLGLFWQALGTAGYPTFEEQPPVPASLETFGPVKQGEVPHFEFLETPPMPRYLFVSSSGNEVVQIQQDRLTVNWRKRSSADIYPRFEAIFDLFKEVASKFEAFLQENALGKIVCTQAEVTYVNRIEVAEPSGLKGLLSLYTGGFTDDFLQEPEEVYTSFRFPLFREDARVGRLYIDLRPEVPGDKEGPLKMVLVARGRPEGTSIEEASLFFVLGRKYIVSGFASITSTQAHQAWGRKDHADVSEREK